MFPGGVVDGPNADELLLAVEGEGAAPTSTPPVVAMILLLWLVLRRGSHPPVVLLRGGSPPLLPSLKALLTYCALAMVVVASGVSLFSPSTSFNRNSTRTPLDLEHRNQKHHRFGTLNTTSRTLSDL